MNIIPAIDIIDGKCVRLSQGNYGQKKIYNDNPLEVAKQFEDAGLKYLHLVDLDGARSHHIVNQQILKEIASNTSLKIDFGGGLKSDEDLRIAFDNGASQVTAGSIAVKSFETVKSWINIYGAEKIILGADVLNGQIAVNGWQEKSDILLLDFLYQYVQLGIQYVICTDISKDGMMAGPGYEIYNTIMERFPKLNLIASGGVSSMADVQKLSASGLYGAIIGKAIYEGNINIQELAKSL